jgi:hypothetical protein
MRRTISILATISLVFFLAAGTALAGGQQCIDSWDLLAKASPDECFYDVGSDSNQYPLIDSCEPPGQLKTNQAYVWGLTKYGDNMFFGTGPNIHCLVIGGYLGQTDPILTEDYVCEASANPPFGDVRPPGMYMYNDTDGLTSLVGSLGAAQPLRLQTLGIRSAGSHNNVAFLAGPGSGGINIFGFDATTGAFLTATTLTEYSNIRKWLVVGDMLFVGVGSDPTDTVDEGGAVLRWIGKYSTDPAILFDFEVVGDGLDGIASELTEDDGIIYTSTWPGGFQNTAGVWMSPPIADLSPLNPNPNKGWVKVWSASDYEPDPVTAATYGGGAIAVLKDWVYWGTMHVPGTSALAHQGLYYGDDSPPPTEEAIIQMFVGTWRAISIFRGRDLGTPNQEIQLLYGGSALPTVPPGHYNAYLCPGGTHPLTCDASSRSWQTVPNKMGLTPLYGRAGFNNLFNNYCWTMRKGCGKIYVGTMDHSYLVLGGIADIPPEVSEILAEHGYAFGADLYRFDNNRSPAVPVTIDGAGNPMNYGFRTMLCDDEICNLGTANPMNLNPDGGWELYEMTSCYCGIPQKVCKGDFDWDKDVDGTDAKEIQNHFGRCILENPCTNVDPCKGDFDIDSDVDGTDVFEFKADFGRSVMNNPCPE